MKKFLLIMALGAVAFLSQAQTTTTADRLVVRQAMYLKNRWIDSVHNDTTDMFNQRTIMTADAIRRYVQARMGVSDSAIMASRYWVNSQGYLKNIPTWQQVLQAGGITTASATTTGTITGGSVQVTGGKVILWEAGGVGVGDFYNGGNLHTSINANYGGNVSTSRIELNPVTTHPTAPATNTGFFYQIGGVPYYAYNNTRTPIALGSSGSSYTFQHSIVNNAGTVNLVGDAAAPGNSKYYGTNGSGVRGFYDLPTGGGGSVGTLQQVTSAGNSTSNEVLINTSDQGDYKLQIGGNIYASGNNLFAGDGITTIQDSRDTASLNNLVPIFQTQNAFGSTKIGTWIRQDGVLFPVARYTNPSHDYYWTNGANSIGGIYYNISAKRFYGNLGQTDNPADHPPGEWRQFVMAGDVATGSRNGLTKNDMWNELGGGMNRTTHITTDAGGIIGNAAPYTANDFYIGARPPSTPYIHLLFGNKASTGQWEIRPNSGEINLYGLPQLAISSNGVNNNSSGIEVNMGAGAWYDNLYAGKFNISLSTDAARTSVNPITGITATASATGGGNASVKAAYFDAANSATGPNNTTTYSIYTNRGRIHLGDVPTYADDAAAGAAGLVAGDVYKTSSGQLMIKL